ncbi:hypothetical protein Bxe_A0221 [Paraburkholderia xenovorans LB400]|uniref:Uncharacterized protein n=1 Tax=Paraburkholderia xenovorans (strain LB400) TaxID=266265 RepID=Q13T78_PARXL|nr:hypothetical protein Bxe_A0221 [Paraburkholderia xenovorans LB400]
MISRRHRQSGTPERYITHGIIVVDVFYENVSKAKAEGRTLADGEKDENLVIEFRPEDGEPMFVACLWSRWTAPGQPNLLSSRQSPTSRLRRSLRRVMTDASFPSSPRTSRLGYIPTQRTLPRSTQSSTTGTAPSMNTAWQRRRGNSVLLLV